MAQTDTHRPERRCDADEWVADAAANGAARCDLDSSLQEFVSVTRHRDDPAYDPDTYDSSLDMRGFTWFAAATPEDVAYHRSGGEVPGGAGHRGFLVVEYYADVDAVGDLGPRELHDDTLTYIYGTGRVRVPLLTYARLRWAAENDCRAEVHRPSIGGVQEVTPGEFVAREVGHQAKHRTGAIGHEGNYVRAADVAVPSNTFPF